MKRALLQIALVTMLTLVPAAGFALEVVEGVITTDVVDRAPVDAVESYSASVDRLYCFTRILGAETGTEVVHVWYWQGREMARVELPVRSGNWRTWSSKKLLPQWTGHWKVEVLGPEGQVLQTLDFELI